jgi:transposase-like protein
MIRRHLLEGVAVSDLCEELGIHATQYYTWQKQLFENGAVAFGRRPNQATSDAKKTHAKRRSPSWRKSCNARMKWWLNCWRSMSS